MTARRWPRSFFVAVPLATTVLVLLAVELGLRLFHPAPYAPEHNMVFDADPDTGYRLRPGGSATFGNGAHGVANNEGLRNREVGPKPPGAFRILVLGDSFTEGAGVEKEEAYPQVLEKILRRRIARAVEVVNTGVGGWDPFQYAQYFERHGLAFEPDLVLVGFFVGNDTYSEYLTVETLPTAIGGRRVSRTAARRRSIRLAVFLQEHFHLARALRGRASGFETRRSCEDFSPWSLEAQAGRLGNHRVRTEARDARAQPNVDQILRIQRLAGARGVPVVVALLPDENQINAALQARLLAGKDPAAYDFEMPQSMLAALFAGRDVCLVDLLPDFRRDPRCLYMNDTHWNPDGQALAADALARVILPLIPPARELAVMR
jgi:lysophospholipase L1-like esterase